MYTHLLPNSDVVKEPEITFVIPAMNEEITIAEFVEWCKAGLRSCGISGQILIVDSSDDRTAEIALLHGAEVLKTPASGLGKAYLDAIPHIRSHYVIMCDADLTYDVRLVQPFLEKFRAGSEFIMGSRFKGSIEKNAMPKLHRYFGTPITTWLLNRIYGSHFSDIHCGLRGVTLDALKRMQLQSHSWQYASEMIIKAIHLQLNYTEVPVTFYADREGRLSHMKRLGWMGSWVAGWVNLKAILIYGADFFLFKVGFIFLVLGMLGLCTLYNGPVIIFKIGFQLHWMLFFLLAFLIGLQFSLMGILARVIYDLEFKKRSKLDNIFYLEYVIPISIVLNLLGLLSIYPILKAYVQAGYVLNPIIDVASYQAIGGVGLILASIIYFTTSLLYNALHMNKACVR